MVIRYVAAADHAAGFATVAAAEKGEDVFAIDIHELVQDMGMNSGNGQ